MSGPLRFEVEATCCESGARLGRVETPHGSFDTPAFMPVGTQSCVKGLWPHQVAETGSQIILNNAYHLMLRPGDAAVARRGGCHQFMRWSGPILTDSGGTRPIRWRTSIDLMRMVCVFDPSSMVRGLISVPSDRWKCRTTSARTSSWRLTIALRPVIPKMLWAFANA